MWCRLFFVSTPHSYPLGLTAPTAAALLRVLASAADTAQRAAPTSISAANVDTALVSLLLWLRGQFLRGGAAMQASIVLSLLDGETPVHYHPWPTQSLPL